MTSQPYFLLTLLFSESLRSNLSNGTKVLPTLPGATEDGEVICESAVNIARHNTPMCYVYY